MAVRPDDINLAAEFIRTRRGIESTINPRVRCPYTAADLAGDMYLKLVRLQPTAQTPGEAWGYLNKMANRIAIDHLRNNRRRNEILNESADLLQSEVDVELEPAILARDEMKIVEAALAELPGKCRDMLILSRMHGMTHDEIAARMDVSKSLIEKYLIRALQHCQQRLTEARMPLTLAGDEGHAGKVAE